MPANVLSLYPLGLTARDLNLVQPPGEDPDHYLDGDYSQRMVTGTLLPEFPFLDQANTACVIYREPCEQLISAYSPPDLTAIVGGGYGQPLYCLGDRNFRDTGCGVVAFERRYACVPGTRVVRGQSHRYGFQYILKSGEKLSGIGTDQLSYEGPTYSLGAETVEVDSRLVYNYFLAGNEANFPLIKAPKLIQVGQKIQARGYSLYPGYGNSVSGLYISGTCVCSNDEFMLAEDDKYGDWHGAIRYRVRRLIAGPTPSLWAN